MIDTMNTMDSNYDSYTELCYLLHDWNKEDLRAAVNRIQPKPSWERWTDDVLPSFEKATTPGVFPPWVERVASCLWYGGSERPDVAESLAAQLKVSWRRRTTSTPLKFERHDEMFAGKEPVGVIVLNIHTSRIEPISTLQLFYKGEGIPTSTYRMPEVAKGDEKRAVREYLAAWRRKEVDRDQIGLNDERRWLEAATELRVTRSTTFAATYRKDDEGWWKLDGSSTM